METLNQVKDAVLKGNLPLAVESVKKALDEGADPQTIINEYMASAMAEKGKMFEEGKAFVPEMLMSARAMKGALEILKPLMTSGNTTKVGTVVIGTVKGDLHDIGKNLVASMLEGAGFEVINLGVDVSAEKFITTAKESNANIICLSALLTTTMNYMKEVIDALSTAGMRDKVKVMIGGAPISQSFATEINADGYSSNANSAVSLANSLVGR